MEYLVHRSIHDDVLFLTNLPLSVGLGPVISPLNVPLQIYYQVIAISIECLLYHHTLLAVYSTIFEIP